MSQSFLLNVLIYVEPVACALTLMLMGHKRQLRHFGFLTAFLSVRLLSLAILLPVLHFGGLPHGIERHLAYKIYFYAYWSSYAIEAGIGFGIIYSLYKLSMAPLPGLQRLGTIMFRWAGGIAIALALSVACGPHVTSSRFIMKFVSELQQTQAVLTLCMLFFVTLASKPMGLSHRSKIFGISLGLGVISATDLLTSGWIVHSLYMGSVINLINSLAILVTFSIWLAYFAMPEPKRRMIVLPTTSPFLRWNQISQVLGDEPGFVALGRMTPDMFAPAEVEIMLRASAKISAQRLPAERLSAVG